MLSYYVGPVYNRHDWDSEPFICSFHSYPLSIKVVLIGTYYKALMSKVAQKETRDLNP